VVVSATHASRDRSETRHRETGCQCVVDTRRERDLMGAAYVCWRISETTLTKAVSTLDESLAEASMNCSPCLSANR
jgi:hypothetical protein